ncbi:hypothetical protein DL96DRAFT_299510 [Flagelloscypha sp. PMI_526]|nr:hypothetical protein DL96DRAFT_299510 [Flagelloscypha sp. PMI_526]
MDQAAPVEYNSTLGAILIGVFCAILFQGILTVQAYYYYESFPEDARWHKICVAVVWLLDLVHLALICELIYTALVTHWSSNLPPDVVIFQSITFKTHLPFLAVATLICQGYFILRIWIFGTAPILRVWTVILALGCLTTFGLELVVGFKPHGTIDDIKGLMQTKRETIAMFAVQASVDILMAITLVALLRARIDGAHSRTESILAKVIRTSVSSTAITSLVALGALTANVVQPRGLAFIAMHFSLGRLYTISFLATLNQRRKFRENASSINPQISTVAFRGAGISGTTVGMESGVYAMEDKQPAVRVDVHQQTRSYV